MRISRIERTAAANAKLDANEQASIQQVCGYLRTSLPGIGPLLQNPNNMVFLMKLLEVVAANPDSINILRNSVMKVQAAMAKDPTSTMALLGKV